jgi:hypothetical protein
VGDSFSELDRHMQATRAVRIKSFLDQLFIKQREPSSMTSREPSYRSNNSSHLENALHSQSSGVAASGANDRQPPPTIQWGLVVFAGLLVYLTPQLPLSTYASTIFSAASVAISTANKPINNESGLNGKTSVFMIEHDFHAEHTKRQDVVCDSERSLPIVIRVPSCR